MIRINNTFYVSVEGYTEMKYLDRVQYLINQGNFKTKVKFIKKISKPTSFVKAYSNGFSEYPYFHICDYEGNTDEDNKKFMHVLDDLKNARLIKKSKFNLAYTNLCFELWLILHKKQFGKQIFNKESYRQEINSAYGLDFNSWDDIKKDENLDKIINQIQIQDVILALQRAKSINEYSVENFAIQKYKGSEFYKENPSLNINEFIELVLKKCGVI